MQPKKAGGLFAKHQPWSLAVTYSQYQSTFMTNAQNMLPWLTGLS
jgi:hypothetical protein